MHFLLVLVAAYFLPTIIAFARNHHNACAICALNAFLGWTVIGWIAALVWSLTDPQRLNAPRPPSAA